MVFLCCGCGILIGIDGPLPGLVQPVHDLLGRLGSFRPDPVASSVKRGLASLHSMVQEIAVFCIDWGKEVLFGNITVAK